VKNREARRESERSSRPAGGNRNLTFSFLKNTGVVLLVHHPDDDIEDDHKQDGNQYRSGTGKVDGHIFTAINENTRQAIEIYIQLREQVIHASRQDEYAAK
jgi:hypothetical protein